MLEHLRIRNYALIDELKISFIKGFNVLTGETGAGKSIILGALNIILGEKASMELIRTGEQKALIEAGFDISDNLQAFAILDNWGIDYDRSDLLILRREITSDGKNKNYINSTPVTLSNLKELGDILVDIHGQHEHQSLLKVSTHIELIDNFGKLDKERQELKSEYNHYQILINRLEKLQMNEQEKVRLLDILKFTIDEIEKAELKPGEDIELEKEFLIMNNQEKIFQSLENSYNYLYNGENDIYSRLGQIINDLSDIEKFDNNIVSIKQKIEESYYLLEDAVTGVRSYKDNLTFSPERLDLINERLELIAKLKKKYGGSVEEILQYKEKCINDLNTIEQSEEEIEKTRGEIKVSEKKLNELAVQLSGRRRVVAKLFEEKITEQLQHLDMKKCTFKVNIEYISATDGIVLVDNQRYKLKEDGMDNIEFLIAPNIGETLKPLRKIASGGEISRIMLALKTVLNDVDNVQTLIFDEIDVGIGGKTADMVGSKIAFLSKTKQIISITHEAMIARFADKHFFISKEVDNNRTFTKVHELSDNGRVYEIARMIAGNKISDAILQHAKELLQK